MSQPQRFAPHPRLRQRRTPTDQPQGAPQTTSLDLFGGGTMLAQTVARLDGLVPAENILILTNVQQEPGVRAKIPPQIPALQYHGGTDKRDTALTIVLGIGFGRAAGPRR
ncbi:MAG: hypothetical protein R3F11_06590 [Verrucomicrobiales bacterium]